MHAPEQHENGLLHILATDLAANASELEHLMLGGHRGNGHTIGALLDNIDGTLQHFRRRREATDPSGRPLPPPTAVTFPEKEHN